VQQVEFDTSLERQAFSVYADNVERLGLFRNSEQLKRHWAQWVNTLSKARCAEFWGAWDGARLVAFSVVAFSPGGAEIVCSRSLTGALNLYPNNALVFRIATSVFERGVPVLSYGLGEFGGDKGGLDHFKRDMAFDAIPLQDHFCWHPALRLFDPLLKANHLHAVARFLKKLARKSPSRKLPNRPPSGAPPVQD